ncbi:MBL fold metallo-hydrolase [Stigmatella sp. ncwal1]|uniref:MBL fold metallo-hydrolase n=1 Tax=Stigmatella ashevillensis TaxID=2995309 RepID=A0ABT5DBT2_9BACT|nr:MBL fold metallo-hydrolase [Stigmatella ashevillena]MDC0711064.1 MBL fold metallo-hydrolase [Stigmatella ashevillena]
MTHGVRLKPLWWVLVPEEDAAATMPLDPSTGRRWLEGGPRHAASAQSVYFHPGTMAEAQRLRTLLDGIGRPFPTTREVHQALAQAPELTRLYEFHAEPGDRWYLRNTSRMEKGSPFENRRWQLVFDTPGQSLTLTLEGEQLETLFKLMPLLNGELTFEQLVQSLRGDEPGKFLLRQLAHGGALEAAPLPSFCVGDLPELLFLGHSSLALRHGEELVVIDPIGFPSNEQLSGTTRPFFPVISRATAFVISHHHWDHLHFQTLVRLPRQTPFLVPRNQQESFINPSVARYLRHLGFTDVRECDPWEEVRVGGLRLRFAPFYGEPFGLGSHFDGLTYHIEFGGRRLYGTVDAWRDELGDMEATVARVAEWGPLDLFLFGASDQHHAPPYNAPGYRYFSNELQDRPDLMRYHPNTGDAERWARVLRPRILMPYAEFIFDGARRMDLTFDDLEQQAPATLGDVEASRHKEAHLQWCQRLSQLSRNVGLPLLVLHPMQGVRA